MSSLSTPTSLSALTAGNWNVDPTHSRIGFVARHLMITKVRGSFATFAGTITIAPDLADSKVEASADLASVTTGDESRDGHLKSADFFDVEKFPTMTFVSKGLSVDGDEGRLTGDLTLHGVTRPVTFQVEFDGVGTDPWGNTKASFSATTEVNRKDWGLEWNVALEAGGVLVSEKVKIELDIQAVRA